MSDIAVPDYKTCQKKYHEDGAWLPWFCILRAIHTGQCYDPVAEQFWEIRDGELVTY